MILRSRIAALSLGFAAATGAQASTLPVEVVADIHGAMPTGIAVLPNGRIFVNYPQWGDSPPSAIAEIRAGKVIPIADGTFGDGPDAAHRLVSVQSVVAGANNLLWILDTGAPKFSAPVAGGAKLVAFDPSLGKVVRSIVLGPDVVLPTTYINDVRVDLHQGAQGFAYITDSSVEGPGGIIVVDLETGHAVRRLSGHPSTMPDKGFVPYIEGQPLMVRPSSSKPAPWLVASDGIALSPDGATLYYCALSSRHFYSVPTALLRDPKADDATIASAINDLGAKPPSDGLAADDRGDIFAGDYEHGVISRFHDGRWSTVARDPRILWPDTLSISTDGWLYFTANQLYRQGLFHRGVDLRRQPYQILRVHLGVGPALPQ